MNGNAFPSAAGRDTQRRATFVIWGRCGAVLGILAAVLMLYWPAVQSLWRYWNDTESLTYTHGHLIALISLGLLVRARAQIAVAAIEPKPFAAAGVLAAGMVWLVAYHSALQIVYLALLPVLMWGAVYSMFGSRVARLCLFPLSYLYFAVPLWGSINAIPQWGTVFAVRAMLRAIGIPAYFDENFVQVPAGTFEIAGGCSGLHFLIVALALAVLLGELRREALLPRIGLALLAAGLAVLANWVRVFTIIVAGHLTDMRHYLVQEDHYYFGWVLFALAMAAFFLIARRLGRESPDGPAVATDNTDAPAFAMAKIWASSALTLAALSTPVAWGAIVNAAATLPARFMALPLPPGGWSGPRAINRAINGEWRPVFEGNDRFAQGLYLKGERRVEVSTAWYLVQRQGKELGSYNNSVTGSGLRVTAGSRALAGNKPFAELTVVDSAGSSWVLWYGYEIGGRWFVDATRAQVWYGVLSLGGPQLSHALLLRSPCIPDCDSARRTLGDFIEQG